MERVDTGFTIPQETTTRSSFAPVHRNGNMTTKPKPADFTIGGFFKKRLIHISAFVLSNGKVSFKTDLCDKRQVVSKETLVEWASKKPLLIYRAYVDVVLCENNIRISLGDIKNLINRVNQLQK